MPLYDPFQNSYVNRNFFCELFQKWIFVEVKNAPKKQHNLNKKFKKANHGEQAYYYWGYIYWGYNQLNGAIYIKKNCFRNCGCTPISFFILNLIPSNSLERVHLAYKTFNYFRTSNCPGVFVPGFFFSARLSTLHLALRYFGIPKEMFPFDLCRRR